VRLGRGLSTIAAAHAPSGERAATDPSPKRTAGAPSVLRMYTAYEPERLPEPPSMNRTVRPSADRSVTTGVSSHERSRGTSSPAARSFM
jgi:hypothetical protein